MKTVILYRYDPIGEHQAPSFELLIDTDLPEMDSFDEAKRIYREQAESIFQALRSLPQGTRYQLALLILAETPNLYRGS
jgi:hypothetical protein